MKPGTVAMGPICGVETLGSQIGITMKDGYGVETAYFVIPENSIDFYVVPKLFTIMMRSEP